MAAFTISFLISGLLSPLAGNALYRWGDRKVIIISAIIFGAGLIGLSTINSLIEYYLYSALMGVGMAGIGPIPASNIIHHHFHENRGMAIGFMSVGIGLGGIVLCPIVASLVIPALGWRAAYILLAVFSWLALIPITAFALKPITVPANSDNEQPIIQIEHPGLTLKQAIAAPAFWLIIIVVFLTQLSQTGAVQNQLPYMNDLGFPVALASLCLGIIGLASAAGKYLFGWLCDRIRANHAALIGMALQVAGLILLLYITSSSTAAYAITFACVLGLGTGAWLPTMSMMTSENLGIKEYANVFGVISVSHAAGTALGPFVTSVIFDHTGDYKIAFIIAIALYAISAPAALLIKKAYGKRDKT